MEALVVSKPHIRAGGAEQSRAGSIAKPMLIEPNSAKVALLDWVQANRALVDRGLAEPGAVLFRGFRPQRMEFEQVCLTISGSFMEYEYRSNNRTRLSRNLFNSTEYPASERIPFHNEMSYFSVWPRHVWFLCEIPAAARGDTPLADSVETYQRLPPDVREPFERLGVRYTRTIGPQVDLSWRDVFQTNDRSAVNQYCARFGIEHEWLDSECLRTAQVRPAVIRHPDTGDPVWFNQAHLFHPSALGPEVHQWLLRRYGHDMLPRNAMYGDGTPIPTEALEAIRTVYSQLAFATPWQAGDVLLFDNMRLAHARDSFTPPRRIVVGLAGIVSDANLAGSAVG